MSTEKKRIQMTTQTRRLLLIGPKPPPIGGSPLTVQAMLEEFANYPSLQVILINTSPGMDVRKKMTGFNWEKVKRSFTIFYHYIRDIRHCDAALVFANDLFAITLAPILLLFSKIYGKPFFLKPVGAGLDLFINAQPKLFRIYLLSILRAMEGILTQTQLLKDDLKKMGCANVNYLPGCRPLPAMMLVPKSSSEKMRLVYLGHITRFKGPLILLNALRTSSELCDVQVTCDFYGPIHEEIQDEFLAELNSSPNANYCGIAKAGTGPQLISQYDALVLPTYYDTEGHPGVLIEAMHAGVPVISTQVRTLPELIENGSNGFLVPTQNSHALANAIVQLARDPDMRRKMGEANLRKGQEFRADTVVAKLLSIVFPDFSFARKPN
ncbi:MAG: glycosyltransferase family 4 protein [Anaerolineales bacterium]|nr:MAG: glycosyltransferase family 4 protein [Anaerolineales bacterium]